MPVQPQFDERLPRPDFAHLVVLADEVVATVGIGIHDPDQRALLIGEARDLIERIQATLVEIEETNPTWPGWAVVEPPKGTMVKQLRDLDEPTTLAASTASRAWSRRSARSPGVTGTA